MRIHDWRRPRVDHAKTEELLSRVWGLEAGTDVFQIDAYREHFEEAASLIDHQCLLISDGQSIKVDHIVKLIALIKENSLLSIKEIKALIQAENWSWIAEGSNNDETAVEAIKFALHLWLFMKIDLSDENLRLHAVIQSSLPRRIANDAGGSNVPDSSALTDDFSAKNLTRIGGLQLVFTSDLSEHLSIVDNRFVHVFKHAAVLRKYAESRVERYAPQQAACAISNFAFYSVQ